MNKTIVTFVAFLLSGSALAGSHVSRTVALPYIDTPIQELAIENVVFGKAVLGAHEIDCSREDCGYTHDVAFNKVQVTYGYKTESGDRAEGNGSDYGLQEAGGTVVFDISEFTPEQQLLLKAGRGRDLFSISSWNEQRQVAFQDEKRSETCIIPAHGDGSDSYKPHCTPHIVYQYEARTGTSVKVSVSE